MATSDLTTFISLFHSADRAEEALDALVHAGFQRSAITSTWNSEPGDDPVDYTSEFNRIGVPERDQSHFQQSLEKGGVVISLDAPEDRSDDIERIFHKYSADKVDETDVEREGVAAAPVATPRLVAEPVPTQSDVIPVAVEELAVGKREVDRGGVRVFQRTVTEPVSESVNLHEEHVVLDRRPVDRAVTEADFAGAGQTIELVETDEVPVLTKSAHVVEEVHVGKIASDRTETVSDTVRHTEVDIEPLDDDQRIARNSGERL